MKERLFEKKTPELKFWHDAAGWCPHCMVTFRGILESNSNLSSVAILFS